MCVLLSPNRQHEHAVGFHTVGFQEVRKMTLRETKLPPGGFPARKNKNTNVNKRQSEASGTAKNASRGVPQNVRFFFSVGLPVTPSPLPSARLLQDPFVVCQDQQTQRQTHCKHVRSFFLHEVSYCFIFIVCLLMLFSFSFISPPVFPLFLLLFSL